MEWGVARLQAPPSFWVEVEEFLEFMAPVVVWYCCALKLRPWLPWLDEAVALHSVEAEGYPIMSFLVGDHAEPLRQQLVLLDPRWWHLWVALLVHAMDCTARECQCILYPHCQPYYWQWTHLQSCSERGCQLQECTLLEALLDHCWNCADLPDHMECALCEDVECRLGMWKTYTENRDFYRAEGWRWKCSLKDLFD